MVTRIRIPFSSYLFVAFSMAYLLLFACPSAAHAQVLENPPYTIITAPFPIVPYAVSNGWSTALIGSSLGEAGVMRYSDSPLVQWDPIDPNGTAYVPSLDGWITGPMFGSLRNEDPAHVREVAVLTFDDGVYHAQFSVPQLEYEMTAVGQSGWIDRIVNDGKSSTYLVLLNTAKAIGAVTLEVYDGHGHQVAREYAQLQPGLNFYALQTPLVCGRLRIVEGYENLGPNTDVSVYAFAAIGPASGTSQRVEVLHP